MRVLTFLAMVALALTFSHDTAYRQRHGWPDRCVYGQEARALDAVSAAGGQVSSFADEVHIEFPEECLAVREREHIYISCGFGWLTYDGPSIEGRRVSDTEIGLLPNVPSVVGVDLCGTQVSDRVLDSLQKLPRLRYIYAYGTTISDDAIDRFRTNRPDVTVRTDDRLGFNATD